MMYEAEIDVKVDSIDLIPEEIVQKTGFLKPRVAMRSVLPWGEHCTECVWPACYRTCGLYAPRLDGGCRLFNDGVVRINNPVGLSPYILKINFKSWAKLWTTAMVNLVPISKANTIEHRNVSIGKILHGIPLPSGAKKRILRKYAYLRKRKAMRPAIERIAPDSFLLECYNPNAHEIQVSFTIRRNKAESIERFTRLITLRPGFNREEVPFWEIAKYLDLSDLAEIELAPNNCSNISLFLIFSDFIKKHDKGGGSSTVAGPGNKASTKCKCVIWDLDNTLWDGILIEDGPGNLKLRAPLISVLQTLDARGILNSIASKNSADDVTRILREHGIDEYFLHPQIGWGPKSQAVEKIAALLNIGTDTLLFVDDQAFEREEVKAAVPCVTVVDASDAENIPQMEFCDVPVTEESQSRRKMYREHETRSSALRSYDGDYMAFLRTCNIRLIMSSLKRDRLDRVYELLQRTNQMNFSGNRYPRHEIEALMDNCNLETYVMKCEDKFGSYGIIGFAVVNIHEPRLLDLMFSCRIQSKKVEHAFFSYLLGEYRSRSYSRFFANFRRTPKNSSSGQVFFDMGFVEEGVKEGVTSYVYELNKEIKNHHVIEILFDNDLRD